VINNRQHFKINSDMHNISTRKIILTCIIQSHLSVHKGAHYTGIVVFNRLHIPIKQLSHDTIQFKMALKGSMYLHSFYWDEYFKYNTN
jgi:hypothetical protein